MRFSIRTLLLAVACFAIIFCIAGLTTRDYRKRYRIEADLRSMGAYYVGFDEDSNAEWVSFAGPVNSPRISTYKSIKHIDFAGARVTDGSIRHIAGVERIEVLHLTNCDVTDSQLGLLVDVGSLRILRLNRSPLTDDAIPSIASIHGLQSVDLSGTLISSDGVAQLKQLCPGIVVRRETQ